MEELAGKTISATDFILALKRYRDEVGVPATSRATMGARTTVTTTRKAGETPARSLPKSEVNMSSALAGKSEKSAQRLDNVAAKTEERKPEVSFPRAGTLPPSLPAKRERTTSKKDAKKDQGSLF